MLRSTNIALVAACILTSVRSVQTDGKSIIIARGGTLGLSTAYYLSKQPKKYKRIRIFDPYPPPAYASAGYDINKIVRTEYDDVIMTRIGHQVMDLWKTDVVFKDTLQNVGYLEGTYAAGNNTEYDKGVEKTKLFGDASKITYFGPDPEGAHIRKYWPWLKDQKPPPDWRGSFNGNGGWGTGAMEALATHLKMLAPRVEFVSGSAGTVTTLL
jgi:sarcosine oxidase/L-pipecolate oxidase